MKSQHCDIWEEHISQFIIIPSVRLAFIMVGCSSFWDYFTDRCYKSEGLNPRIEALIDEFRPSVTEIMKDTKMVGVAIALVGTEATPGRTASDARIASDTRRSHSIRPS